MAYTLTIGWLYPELMSTYGDRGNIFVFRNRCLWRNIGINIKDLSFNTSNKSVQQCDLIFGGGAQDRQQTLVIEDFRIKKGPALAKLFNKWVPGLFVCGSPQLLGHTYMNIDGHILQGLNIFDMESRHFGKAKPRCIGNLLCSIDETFKVDTLTYRSTIVGFENHGGRTYLGSGVKPFAKVIVGYGNNGEDGTEGAVYKNCIATYSHGPFLPKNPHIADWLISKALETKYNKKIILKPLNDAIEWKAHEVMRARLMESGNFSKKSIK